LPRDRRELTLRGDCRRSSGSLRASGSDACSAGPGIATVDAGAKTAAPATAMVATLGKRPKAKPKMRPKAKRKTRRGPMTTTTMKKRRIAQARETKRMAAKSRKRRRRPFGRAPRPASPARRRNGRRLGRCGGGGRAPATSPASRSNSEEASPRHGSSRTRPPPPSRRCSTIGRSRGSRLRRNRCPKTHAPRRPHSREGRVRPSRPA
jgi:hypothetical protein